MTVDNKLLGSGKKYTDNSLTLEVIEEDFQRLWVYHRKTRVGKIICSQEAFDRLEKGMWVKTQKECDKEKSVKAFDTETVKKLFPSR
ncbi:MAG: hypothetical protein ACTSQA_00420 [Candidatus Heimdallarchaeaceae archaeon]